MPGDTQYLCSVLLIVLFPSQVSVDMLHDLFWSACVCLLAAAIIKISHFSLFAKI